MMMGTFESSRMVRQISNPEVPGNSKSRITRPGRTIRYRWVVPHRVRERTLVLARRIRGILSTQVWCDINGMGCIGELTKLSRQEKADLLRDVDGVVAYTFQLTGDEEHP